MGGSQIAFLALALCIILAAFNVWNVDRLEKLEAAVFPTPHTQEAGE